MANMIILCQEGSPSAAHALPLKPHRHILRKSGFSDLIIGFGWLEVGLAFHLWRLEPLPSWPSPL